MADEKKTIVKDMSPFQSHIEIKTDKEITKLFVDGIQVKGVRSLNFEVDVKTRIPTLTIDINALDLTIDGRMVVKQKGINTNIKEFELEYEDVTD